MKTRINLLSSAILPEKQYLTLPGVLFGWVAVLSLCLAIHFYQQQQIEGVEQQRAVLEKQLKQREQTSAMFTKQLGAMAPSTILLNQKKQLSSELHFQKRLLVQFKAEESQAFSAVLDGLAEADHADIWLSTIHYDGQQLALSGEARKPHSVAEWMTGLGQQQAFVGLSFDDLVLTTDDIGHHFQLNSAHIQHTEANQ